MLSPRELATVLAALRFWQRYGPSQQNSAFDRLGIDEQDDLNAIRTDCGRFEPLDASGIDELCERLNAGTDAVADLCECESPGYFYSGVPGIIARVVDGRLEAGAVVERCDACERYPTDEAALAKLRELGIA